MPSLSSKSPLLSPWAMARAAMFMLMLGLAAHSAEANIIYVTTLDDKVSSTGGCSLKEAIFSSNLHTNSAVVSYDLSNAPESVTTQCVAGSGNDTIVLPVGGLLLLRTPQEDVNNYTGPTATPMITSTITIEGYGATLQYAPAQVLCSDGSDNYCPPIFRAFAVGTGGNLTIRNVYIKGFQVQGGSSGLGGGATQGGGGGGMGAGGAIYFNGGTLVVDSSTFDSNGATGGNGSTGAGSGGGGLGGNGSASSGCLTGVGFGGGGGGASGDGGLENCSGHGGGGTVFSSPGGSADSAPGGFNCGGTGGVDASRNGQSAPCPGGGGGGGFQGSLTSGDGGRGSYGGGGGGGAGGGGNGGDGGFGGGGGAGWTGDFGGTNGGNGGFGGGGGAAQDGHIGSGNPGAGGMFGGRANAFNGGGGGALGGAIFNDSGTVTVTNSTFTANHVTRGNGGGAGATGAADNGADAGGAIFSANGHLTLQDSTVSGNQSTGSGGGVVIVQTSPSSPTSLVVLDSIIFNNGAKECSIASGTSVTVAGAGNLIGNNDNCTGVVSADDDPQLGPLQYNGGFTPTMAIAKNTSAWNTADAGTSLGVDQRGQVRPEMGGFDIGAFELCISNPELNTCSGTGSVQPDPLTLLIQTSPLLGGTTTPTPGSNTVQGGTIVPLQAIPNPGYQFQSWLGHVSNEASASTSIVMLEPQVVVANFSACSCVSDVSSFISVVRNGFVLNLATGRYAQTVTLTNHSALTIVGPFSLVLDSLSTNASLFNSVGTTIAFSPVGSPYVSASATLAPGQSVPIALQFTDPTRTTITYSTRVLAGPGSR